MARNSKRAAPPAARKEEPTARRRATTVAPAGRIVPAGGSVNSRIFAYMAGNYLHRIDRERREIYFGDLDLAIVAEVIGMSAVEPGMRDAAFRQKHKTFDTAVPVEEQRAVNATSIATATGIPRETVRRKINQLLKLNVIVEKEPARYCLRPGILHEPYRQAAFARGLAETVRFMNELLAHDVVRWVPAAKARPGGRR